MFTKNNIEKGNIKFFNNTKKFGVVITNNSSNRKMQSEIEKQQAVTDTKLEELTREVREHNNFARRVPVLEEQMKVANHRIEDLEKKGD